MNIIDKEDRVLAVLKLEELRNNMLGNLGEMEEIIRELSRDNRLIWERARSYWHTSISNNLAEDSGSFLGSMVNFQDTVKELKEHNEEVEAGAYDKTDEEEGIFKEEE